MKNKIRVVMCAGGTAGHVSPAIAIADIIKKSYKNAEIIFIGRKNGFENEPVKRAGYNVHELDVLGLKRKITFSNARVFTKLISAVKQCKRIFKEFKPDIVIGTGGYVCLPPLLAARSLKIKTVIHESNAYPGLVTKLLSKRVNAVMLGFEEAANCLKRAKGRSVTGNPIRDDFDKITRKKARMKLGIKDSDKLILSFGGSLGSETMNNCILDLMRDYTSKIEGVYHIHAVGKSYKSEPMLTLMNGEKNGRVRILEYIDDMPTYMRAADVAITRSGAMTLSELLYSKLPSILIPSPNVADNHQLKNARKMEKAGYATVLEEKDLTPQELKKQLMPLLSGGDALGKMRENIKSCSIYNAKEEILRIIRDLVED